MLNWKLSFEHNESVAADKLISLFVEVEFEGHKMKDILNIEGLFSVFREQGYIPMFTCACGTFWCGGYYVKIEHLADGIVLKNGYKPVEKPTENDVIQRFEYTLTWENLFIIANEILNKLIWLKHTYPDYDVCSGTFGEGLLNRLDNYAAFLKEFQK